MLQLHVVFAVDRAGLVGEDGETHHGVFDVGFLRQAPGMTILAPASCEELENMLTWAVQEHNGPVAIRYPRGGDGEYSASHWDVDSGIAIHRTGADCAIITYGTLVNNCLQAAELLANWGIEASVIRLTKLNPLPADALKAALSGISNVLIAEEICHGSGISDALQAKLQRSCKAIDLGPEYVTHGSIRDLYRNYGLDAEAIANKVQEGMRHEN